MIQFGKKAFGVEGEDFAAELLKTKGYTILDKNFRSHFGEIDIIAQDGDTLVFVEVKTRHSKKFGLPEEAVTPRKLVKIIKTAQYYTLLKKDLPRKRRIDVISLIVQGEKVIDSKIIHVGF